VLRGFSTHVGDSGTVLAYYRDGGRRLTRGKGSGEPMYGADRADTFWLDVTNITLGLVTLVCVIVVVAGVLRELGHRLSHARRLADDHAFDTPELGVTMADGGKRIDRK
jgi:hypothetical protein